MSNVIGLKELNQKLARLDAATGVKALRSAAMSSTLPTVKEMKAAAPKGRDVHRTYKGRLVAPGFLSRSVKRATKVKNGRVSVSIGVKREAFYGVMFLDKGTKKIPARNWFKKTFEGNTPQIVGLFKKKLHARIMKASQ